MTRLLLRAAPLTAALFALAGCGDAGPKVVPVSGTVLIDGQPVPKGYVRVIPTGYRPATGVIGPDGRFTLTTMAENDGCVLGTHPVVVLGNEGLDATSQKWHTPPKYADHASSGLTVTITGPTDDLKIELTWDGRKPFVEKFEKEGGTGP